MPEVDTVLSQRDGESNFEYHRRLVYGKLVDKTLSDYDYAELSPYIYGKEYSCDVARRLLYGSCKTLQLLDEEKEQFVKDTSPLSISDDLNATKADIQRERQRLFDQRREYNKIFNAEGRAAHLYDKLADAADKLNETVGVMFDYSEPASHSAEDNVAVLVFSDWHYGLVTDNVFNTYNTSICKERVARIVDLAIERILLHGCRQFHVVVLGDLYNGAIHVSSRVASEELVCDQLMQASEILAQAIARLSQFVDCLDVHITYGNHGRTVQNKAESIHRDNMERIVGWWLTERFRDDEKVTVVPDLGHEFLLIDACGHCLCASHGDLDSVRSSPRTLYSLLQKAFHKDVEYILLGDKHHRESFDDLGITASVCGSLCGSDNYANEKRLYSSPSQTLLIVTPSSGVDAEYHLKC